MTNLEVIVESETGSVALPAVAAIVADSTEHAPLALGVAASPPVPALRSHTILRI